MTGKTIVVTRSETDNAALADALHERGHRVIHEPLTQVVLHHTVRPELEQALLGEPDAVVVTSRHGARALAALSDLRDAPLLCVGEATADVAQSCGFTRVNACGGDAGRLIDYIRSAYDDSAKLIYASAEHVRADLAGALAPDGISIERIVVYEAAAATQLSDTLAEQLKRGQIDAAAFLSQRAARIFASLLEPAGLQGATAPMEAFALSGAVAGALSELPWRKLHVANEPTLASLLLQVDNS